MADKANLDNSHEDNQSSGDDAPLKKSDLTSILDSFKTEMAKIANSAYTARESKREAKEEKVNDVKSQDPIIAKLQKEVESLKRDKAVSNARILETSIESQLSSRGIKAESIKFLKAHFKDQFEVNENGEMVSKDGSEASKFFEDFAKNEGKHFIPASNLQGTGDQGYSRQDGPASDPLAITSAGLDIFNL